MIDPQERTAIVTGAGKRVGAAIARALFEDGWSIIAHVHHETDDPPPGTTKVVADLADGACAEAIFAAATRLPPVRLGWSGRIRFGAVRRSHGRQCAGAGAPDRALRA